mmetsp:Transcript_14005/g.30438  ORF Transcript_14005/g.30438 Transcript_14005/m.30438 type:complete len:267 (-) Transcript_14005:80-880(-)
MAPGPTVDPEEMAEAAQFLPNDSTKTLRACLQCRQVMNKDQFLNLGCPNCKDLGMQGSEGRTLACTTSNFQGFISLIKPGTFLSRFNGLEGRKPGCYALTVKGTIPEKMLRDSESDNASSRGRKRKASEAGALTPSVQDAGSIGVSPASPPTPDHAGFMTPNVKAPTPTGGILTPAVGQASTPVPTGQTPTAAEGGPLTPVPAAASPLRQPGAALAAASSAADATPATASPAATAEATQSAPPAAEAGAEEDFEDDFSAEIVDESG